jgi:hypothetical protein
MNSPDEAAATNNPFVDGQTMFPELMGEPASSLNIPFLPS